MRELSTHAKAAKMIRTELKKNGVKAKVKARTYSGGDSIDVTVYNQLPAAMVEIKKYCDQYQMGHFDGMVDCYEYSNSREDIPQVKFVFVNNEISDEIKQAAWSWMRGYYGGLEEAPESFKDASQVRLWDTWGDQALYRVLNGSEGTFWTNYKPRVKAA